MACPFVCLLFVCKNFYIGHSFWMISDRAFIFHIHISYGNTLSLVPKSRSSVKVKVKYQGQFKKKTSHYEGICVSQTHIVV